MKRWLKITIWILFIGAIITILGVTNSQQKSSVLKTPKIHIDIQDENAFLTEKELYVRLKRKGLISSIQKNEQLQLNRIEKYVNGMTEVLECNVYTKLGGDWAINVKIRRPIARIFNTYGESFYLDELGHTISPSYLYTARVVVVTGDIIDKYNGLTVNKIINNKNLITKYSLDDIYRISRYVCNDPFFSLQIGQIHKEKNGDFVLVPRVGDQKIIFGSALSNEEVKVKFRKLADFYKEGIPYEGWSTYDCFNLKYENQVVCSKKQIGSDQKED
jgi:cell division protein FtsQ